MDMAELSDLLRKQTISDYLKRERLPDFFNAQVAGPNPDLSDLTFSRIGKDTFSLTTADGSPITEKIPEREVRTMLMEISRGRGPKVQQALGLNAIFS